jgi:diguanylate cyclase (GGDEF)-like protein
MFSRLSNATLATKLVTLNLLAACVAGFLALSLASLYGYRAFEHELGKHHFADAKALADQLAVPMRESNWVEVAAQVEQFSRFRHDVARLQVMASDRPVASYLSARDAVGGQTITVPIRYANTVVGQVIWVPDVRPWQLALPGPILATILICLTLLVIAMGVIARIVKRLTLPLGELAGQLRHVASSRDYRRRLEVRGHDEIAVLAENFNDMMTQLQQRDEALDRELEVRLKIQKRVEQLAHFCPLTSLPNRAQFILTLSQALQRRSRTGLEVGVILVDLDNFKSINDTLGHPVGDELLKSVAGLFRDQLRGADFLARLGGDEFAIILEHRKPLKAAAMVAEKLLTALGRPTRIGPHELSVTASIGIVSTLDGIFSADALVRAADAAMYSAKAQGRNQFRLYEPDLDAKAQHRLRLESLLRQAVPREELCLAFQPQIDVRSGRVLAVEALVRWRQPELGLMSPDEFIPVAEQTGLIKVLGQWVLEAACAQAVAWNRGPKATLRGLRMCVNVSGLELQDRQFVSRLQAILNKTQMPARQLELEITETALIADTGIALELLLELRAMGVRIAIDDFGVGYSSMSYLGKLPVVALKIDRSFIASMISRREDASIVSAIVALGRGLELEVIAEGVESQQQLDALAGLQCQTAQGYFVSAPLWPDELASIVPISVKAQMRPPVALAG